MPRALINNLRAAGYEPKEAPVPQSDDGQKHFDIYSQATGKLVASLSEFEAWRWLATMEDMIE